MISKGCTKQLPTEWNKEKGGDACQITQGFLHFSDLLVAIDVALAAVSQEDFRFGNREHKHHDLQDPNTSEKRVVSSLISWFMKLTAICVSAQANTPTAREDHFTF